MEKLFYYYFDRLPKKKIAGDEVLYLLSKEEIAEIKRDEYFTIFFAGLIGAIAVILLYIPQYIFPELFTYGQFLLPVFDITLQPVIIIYSVILVVLEIISLTFLNIYCAHQIAEATGLINSHNKNESSKKELLINLGLEKQQKDILKYGIDPLYGLNKKALLIFNTFILLKATLTNFLFKIFVQKSLGRYAVKAVSDMASIPVFSFWNAIGTYFVLKHVRVVIMGKSLIEDVCNKLKRIDRTTIDKTLLYQTLQYIAISKRDYHYNHYAFTNNLFELFNLKISTEVFVESLYLEKLQELSQQQRSLYEFVIILGFILDGNFSSREKNKIAYLKTKQLLNVNTADIATYQKNFMEGRGIEDMIKKYLCSSETKKWS